MKYNIGDKVLDVSNVFELFSNPYAYKTGFAHLIDTVKKASDERFSTSGEDVDLYSPGLSEKVNYQSNGCDTYFNYQLLHLEKDQKIIHELLSESYVKAKGIEQKSKDAEITRIKAIIETYQSRLDKLTNEGSEQDKLIRERYELLRDTIII